MPDEPPPPAPPPGNGIPKDPDAAQRFRDSTSPVWDMSQERQLQLTFLHHRFNFLLALFSGVVIGTLSARTQTNQIIFLAVGCALCWPLTILLVRSEFKLYCIQDYLKSDINHPYSIIEARLKAGQIGVLVTPWLLRRFCWLLSKLGRIGWLIPCACSAALLVGLILAIRGGALPLFTG